MVDVLGRWARARHLLSWEQRLFVSEALRDAADAIDQGTASGRAPIAAAAAEAGQDGHVRRRGAAALQGSRRGQMMCEPNMTLDELDEERERAIADLLEVLDSHQSFAVVVA